LTEAPYENVRCTKEIFEDARKNYPHMLAIAHVMKEEEIAMAMADPLVMVASDGIYRDHRGHPRGAGTFPRFISRYLRDEKVMDFVQGMKKITLDPARLLGLEDKGSLEIGKDADLCIFDLDKIRDRADFRDGQRPPEGISYVFIGGQRALEEGRIIRKNLGRFIKR
ncbi:MAG TPA: amidohydrolase family protein, partial [Clostridia bacterium]|nr:amidohydrolase family protein [Clostridia bacterium]